MTSVLPAVTVPGEMAVAEASEIAVPARPCRLMRGTLVVGRARPYVSPLAGGGHCLRGGVVTDPWEIEGIYRRVEFYALPWWRRMFRRAPGDPVRSTGWVPTTSPRMIDIPVRLEIGKGP